jgi:hypothetical protein
MMSRNLVFSNCVEAMLGGSIVTTAWRVLTLLMEASCEYTEEAVGDSRQGTVLQIVTKRHKGHRTWKEYLNKRPNLKKMYLKRDTMRWYVTGLIWLWIGTSGGIL